MTDDKPYKSYYTLCLDIEGKLCVVIGGGDVARRKAASLKDTGGDIVVVSPKVDPVLEYMSFQKEIVWKQKEYEPADLEGAYLAVAATDSRETNRRVAEHCKQNRILCNVVDEPDDGSYVAPTTIERGPLTIAIATSGISPSLAASIRQELEMAYGEEYGMFLELMAPFRDIIKEEFPFPQQRMKIYDRMVSSRAISMLRNGMNDQAEKELREIIYRAKEEFAKQPGDSLPIMNQ